jgi:hypothetical protein
MQEVGVFLWFVIPIGQHNSSVYMIVPCIHENLNTPISHHTETVRGSKHPLKVSLGKGIK